MPAHADIRTELVAERSVPTLGVEEEFFLVRRDGTPAATAPAVLHDLVDDEHVHHEWTLCQVEAVTSPALRLATLAAELTDRRSTIGAAAVAHGSLVVASGTPPRAVPDDMPVFEDPRYVRMLGRFGASGARRTTCACHVHVAVPSRDAGVAVLNRIRGWLPVLLALGANSPFWGGEDTGWHSYRHVVQGQWPTSTVAPVLADATAYDDVLVSTLEAGAAVDVGSVYWLARLSSKYPTVEIRLADTGLTVADTVLTAALCRAMVMTALDDATFGVPRDGVPAEVDLAAALATAAKHGLRGMLLEPESGTSTVGGLVLHRLVQRLTPALARAGDLAAVETLLRHRLRQRSGASRQLRLRQRLSAEDFVAALADATLPRQSRRLATRDASIPRQGRDPGDAQDRPNPVRRAGRGRAEGGGRVPRRHGEEWRR